VSRADLQGAYRIRYAPFFMAERRVLSSTALFPGAGSGSTVRPGIQYKTS